MGSPPDVADNFHNWLDLPPEVMESILRRLGAVEILKSVEKVCLSWRRLCKEPSIWRSVNMCYRLNLAKTHDEYKRLCRNAVTRSRGQLVDIKIGYFGTTPLLEYIADSSSQLKRLQLVNCIFISNEGLSRAVAKLSLLEELDISNCLFSDETLATVGHCCPLLKTLKYNSYGMTSHKLKYNSYALISHEQFREEAFAIAQNMPELRHLQLVGKGKYLTDDGLQAILDGCPRFESLDICQGFFVNLASNLEKRCAERIKDFRRPHDSMDDYEYREFWIPM